jgi:hypothetical protein
MSFCGRASRYIVDNDAVWASSEKLNEDRSDYGVYSMCVWFRLVIIIINGRLLLFSFSVLHQWQQGRIRLIRPRQDNHTKDNAQYFDFNVRCGCPRWVGGVQTWIIAARKGGLGATAIRNLPPCECAQDLPAAEKKWQIRRGLWLPPDARQLADF